MCITGSCGRYVLCALCRSHLTSSVHVAGNGGSCCSSCSISSRETLRRFSGSQECYSRALARQSWFTSAFCAPGSVYLGIKILGLQFSFLECLEHVNFLSFSHVVLLWKCQMESNGLYIESHWSLYIDAQRISLFS